MSDVSVLVAGTSRRAEDIARDLQRHLRHLDAALSGMDRAAVQLDAWAGTIYDRVQAGGRLLVAGNGGSAAQAQHLAAELVGRYRAERAPFSAIALTADSSTTTALANDYGVSELFARQVMAHGRQGDVLLLLSTSGRSPNVVRAAEVGAERGLMTLALTGEAPNPLGDAAHHHVAVPSGDTAAVQEAHQVMIHLLCECFDARVPTIVAVPS